MDRSRSISRAAQARRKRRSWARIAAANCWRARRPIFSPEPQGVAMRILVTRPIDDARRTAARLVEMGHEAILSPVIEIKPTGAAIANEKFDLVIATSSQALRYCGEEARFLRGLPLAVVGARTARAAAKHGFRAPVHIAENASALADYVKSS